MLVCYELEVDAERLLVAFQVEFDGLGLAVEVSVSLLGHSVAYVFKLACLLPLLLLNLPHPLMLHYYCFLSFSHELIALDNDVSDPCYFKILPLLALNDAFFQMIPELYFLYCLFQLVRTQVRKTLRLTNGVQLHLEAVVKLADGFRCRIEFGVQLWKEANP
jgi:hypothetical protein